MHLHSLEMLTYLARLRKGFDKLKYIPADFENASRKINDYFTTVRMRGLSKIGEPAACTVFCVVLKRLTFMARPSL